MVTLTFLFVICVLADGRPLEIVSDLSMGDLRSRKILYEINMRPGSGAPKNGITMK